MSSSTDTFNFNSSEMFARIRAGLPSDKSKTQDLLESKDDLLFAWDSTKCWLLALNWRAAKVKGFDEVKFQTLIPSIQRNFQVEKLLLSPEGSLIALAGTNGVSALELPNRWGPNGYYSEGKDQIICRSYNLHEDVFENNSHLQLLQIRWHPASPTDSHLLILLSDNTICVYDVYNETTLKHVWRVGPLPSIQPLMKTPPTTTSATTTTSSSSPLSTATISLMYSLGEAAVDFDIAPPRVVSSGSNDFTKNTRDSRINSKTYNSDINESTSTIISLKDDRKKGGRSRTVTTDGVGNQNTLGSAKSSGKVEWPIVILRENGNIYILCAGIDTERPKLQGPLTIQPQTEDNYGIDSCSILVIPSLPPALIIAESSGKLHHALLLETEVEEEYFSESDSFLIIHPCEWYVNVVETVELELGLKDNKKKSQFYCPVHLKRDFINEFRYFAYHNTGLHVIFMNFVKQLQRFVDAEDCVGGLSFTTPSSCEYIVCTKVEDQSKINAVLGFVLLQMPSGIVLLLGSGQVISLNLIIDANFLPDWNIGTEKTTSQNILPLNSPISSTMGESFVTHIQNILKKSVTQPILSLDKSTEPTTQECYELLTQTIQVLHDEYFAKHEKARNEISKRIQLLNSVKQKQKKEIEYLEHQKDLIQGDAERLAEKYEDIYDRQQVLHKKCQDLIRQANISVPTNTLADKEFIENVASINEKAQKMKQTLKKAQDKIRVQQFHIKKYMDNTTNQELFLPSKQEKTMKEVLTKITQEIDFQIREIKKLRHILNL